MEDIKIQDKNLAELSKLIEEIYQRLDKIDLIIKKESFGEKNDKN